MAVSAAIVKSVQSLISYSMTAVVVMLIYYFIKFFMVAPPSKEDEEASLEHRRQLAREWMEGRAEESRKKKEVKTKKHDHAKRHAQVNNAIDPLEKAADYVPDIKRLLSKPEHLEDSRQALQKFHRYLRRAQRNLQTLRTTQKHTSTVEFRKKISTIEHNLALEREKINAIIAKLPAADATDYAAKITGINGELDTLRGNCITIYGLLEKYVEEDALEVSTITPLPTP